VKRALADTSVFIARESGRPLRDVDLPNEVAVSAITVGELRAGVLAATEVLMRDRRLGTLTVALSLEPLPIDEEVASAWGRLRILLRDAGRRMPVNDSWIAATALAAGVPILTQDDDYDAAAGLDGLRVVRV
jgi:predicted nucleic acid-binding protein